MNKEAMYKVADAIEKLENVRLNMYSWGRADNYMKPDCGTVGCIAWFTIVGLDPNFISHRAPHILVDFNRGMFHMLVYHAQYLLGLSSEQSHRLFIPDEVSFASINGHRSEVPNILRWMADNDSIDWINAIKATNSSIEYDTPTP